MKEPRIFSLQEEVRREAEHIKKELEEDPTLDDIVVTEEMDAALLELIHAYDREEEELDKRAAGGSRHAGGFYNDGVRCIFKCG